MRAQIERDVEPLWLQPGHDLAGGGVLQKGEPVVAWRRAAANVRAVRAVEGFGVVHGPAPCPLASAPPSR